MRFFICKHCGNMIEIIDDKGVPVICCGEKMKELVPNTIEASVEKHLPDVTVSGEEITVQVGSVPHPMADEHHIGFIFLETERGAQRKSLKSGEEPKATFCAPGDKPLAVYAYCNLHGMWKLDI